PCRVRPLQPTPASLVMAETRSMSSCVLAVALALAACSPPPIAATPPLDGEGDDDAPALIDARAMPDAPRADAAHRDAAIRDDASPLPIDASAADHDAS